MVLSPCGPSEEGIASLGKELSLHQPTWVMHESVGNFPLLSPWDWVYAEKNLTDEDLG